VPDSGAGPRTGSSKGGSVNEDDVYSDPERHADLMCGTEEPDCMDASREVWREMRKAFRESEKLGDLLAGNPTENS